VADIEFLGLRIAVMHTLILSEYEGNFLKYKLHNKPILSIEKKLKGDAFSYNFSDVYLESSISTYLVMWEAHLVIFCLTIMENTDVLK
jgi:hypothetical protein